MVLHVPGRCSHNAGQNTRDSPVWGQSCHHHRRRQGHGSPRVPHVHRPGLSSPLEQVPRAVSTLPLRCLCVCHRDGRGSMRDPPGRPRPHVPFAVSVFWGIFSHKIFETRAFSGFALLSSPYRGSTSHSCPGDVAFHGARELQKVRWLGGVIYWGQGGVHLVAVPCPVLSPPVLTIFQAPHCPGITSQR